DALTGGADADLLSGDVTATIWADRFPVSLTPPENDLCRPVPFGEGLSGTSIGGNDSIAGNAGNDILLGDAASLAGEARGGNDVLQGGDGHDRLFGDAYAGFIARPGPDDVPGALVYLPDV